LGGCKSSNSAENTASPMPKNSQPHTNISSNSDQLKQSILDLTDEKAKLQTEIDQQNQTIGELNKAVADLKNQGGVLYDLVNDQPWLQKFKQPQANIKSIKVTLDGNTDSSVTVTDPKLLNTFSGQLYVSRELVGINSGGTFDSDILQCNYQVKLDNGETYGLTVPARGVIVFDQLPNHNFETDKYIHQLCKALVKKPAYIPDLPLFSKMADSGLLLNNPEGVYYFSANRIQGLIYTFLRAKKTELSAPDNAGKALEQYTFYSFGEKTNMNLFEQYIQIINRGKETWYKVDKGLPLQLRSVLSAG
jgi:hypothetical protein